MPPLERKRSGDFRPYHKTHQHDGNPLRLRETPKIGATRIAAQKLKAESPGIIGDYIPGQSRTRRPASQNQGDSGNDYGENPQRLNNLNGKESHTDKVRSKSCFCMFRAVTDAPVMRSPVTTSHHQTTYAP